MKLRIIGDSHVVALGNAYRKIPETHADFPPGMDVEFSKLFPFGTALNQFWERDGDEIVLSRKKTGYRLRNDTLLTRIVPEPDVIYAVSLPYSSKVARDPVWKQYRPWRFPIKARPLVSGGLLERVVHNNLRHIADFIAELKSVCSHLVVIESPPLRPYKGLFEPRYLGEDGAHFVNALGRGVVDSRMAELGIDVVTCPEDAYQAAPRQSFLRPELGSAGKGDYHHANEQYGRMHLKKLADHLKTAGLA